jgi:hypothetical protein
VGVLQVPGPDRGVLKKQGQPSGLADFWEFLPFLLLLCDNGHYWTQWALRPDLWDGGAVIVVRDILVEACRSFPTRTRIAIRFPIIVWCFVLWFRGVRDGRVD